MQYDRREAMDIWDLHGTVRCKAELEGVPDVSLVLTTHLAPADAWRVHPCVQISTGTHPAGTGAAGAASVMEDAGLGAATAAADVAQYKVVFSPPLEPFDLCHFTVSGIKELPVSGTYRMKVVERCVVRVALQLSLGANVANAFDYCEVHLPLEQCGTVRRFDCQPSCGTLVLDPDRRGLVWHVGSKLSGHGSRGAALVGTVVFADDSSDVDDRSGAASGADRWSTASVSELHAGFARMRYRIPDLSLSGYTADPRALAVYPTPLAKCE